MGGQVGRGGEEWKRVVGGERRRKEITGEEKEKMKVKTVGDKDKGEMKGTGREWERRRVSLLLVACTCSLCVPCELPTCIFVREMISASLFGRFQTVSPV